MKDSGHASGMHSGQDSYSEDFGADFRGDNSMDSTIDFGKSSILGRSLGTNTEAPKASVFACHMLVGPPCEAQSEEKRTR